VFKYAKVVGALKCTNKINEKKTANFVGSSIKENILTKVEKVRIKTLSFNSKRKQFITSNLTLYVKIQNNSIHEV
jgi:hypothetical protein